MVQRRVAAPLAAALLLVLPGCASDTRAGGAASGRFPGLASAEGAETWPFWPRRMRVHPLSQFTEDRDSGELLLEARIEFFDAFDHTCKAVGRVAIDLHDAASPAFPSDPLVQWVRDLTDLQANREHYDEVTRTYLFRLQIPEPLPEAPELRAYFSSADGRRLQASYRLP